MMWVFGVFADGGFFANDAVLDALCCFHGAIVEENGVVNGGFTNRGTSTYGCMREDRAIFKRAVLSDHDGAFDTNVWTDGRAKSDMDVSDNGGLRIDLTFTAEGAC